MILVASGSNDHCHLGPNVNFYHPDSKIDIILDPMPINIDATKIRSISNGLFQTVIVMDNGSVVVMGSDEDNSIGTGENIVYKDLTQIKMFDEKILKACCGQKFTLYLTEDGKVYFCHKDFGKEKYIVPLDSPAISIVANRYYGCIFDNNGTLYVSKSDSPKVFQKFVIPNIIQVAPGSNFILALTKEGRVYRSRRKDSQSKEYLHFELVESLLNIKITEITAYFDHAILLSSDGVPYVHYFNKYGRLGDGTEAQQPDFSPLQFFAGIPLKSVVAGGSHSLFLTQDNRLFSCGFNKFGQLMNGQYETNQLLPIEINLGAPVRRISAGNVVSFAFIDGNLQEVPQIIERKKTARHDDMGKIEQKQSLNDSLEQIPIVNEIPEQNHIINEVLEQSQSVNEILKPELMFNASDFGDLVELGAGTFGSVWKVQNNDNKKIYARKTISLDEGNRKLICREINILGVLNHELVIKMHGISIDNNCLQIFMDYADNNLRKKIKELTPTQKSIVILEISIAMEYIHSKNIIHRDLKPENILLTKDKHVRIADFGISKIINDDDTTNSQDVGTKNYMSPEILNKQHYDQSTDVFSFGCVIFYIFTQREWASLIKTSEFLNGKRPEFGKMPGFVKELISKCWDNDPGKRPTFHEIIQVLYDKNFFVCDGVECEEVYYIYNHFYPK